MLRPGRYVIQESIDEHGVSGFRQWLDTLDVAARARIQARVLRFESGNFGDAKLLGKGVYEARIMFGPGYRVYFGVHRGEIVLLLLGGDKSTQGGDIRRAQQMWKSFAESQHGS